MRKLIRIFRNIQFLSKVIEEPSTIDKLKKDAWFENVFRIKDVLTGIEKAYLLEAVLAVRELYPYEVGEYDEAKKMYEEYFKMDRHINSIEEVLEKYNSGEEIYVTHFRDDAPVKGDRYCEYYVNGSYGANNQVHKVKDYKESYNYFSLGNDSSLDEDFITSYLYSTPAEIKEYKERQARRKIIKQQIEIKQKELSELYSQI